MVKVSVITVVWNGAAELEKTLSNLTALECSAAELELVVIDGGSTDGTREVMERFGNRIAYGVSEPDGGLYDAMNKGIRAATGDYLWFVNAGDTVWERDALTRIFGAGLPTGADIYYGETLVTDEAGRPLGLRKKPLPHRGLTWRSLERGMVVCHQSFLVRRAIAPLYDTERYRLVRRELFRAGRSLDAPPPGEPPGAVADHAGTLRSVPNARGACRIRLERSLGQAVAPSGVSGVEKITET